MLLAVVSSGVATEQYLCVPDKATGFAYDAKKKGWGVTEFTTNVKWVVAPPKNGKQAFVVTRIGEKRPEYSCKEGVNDSGILLCSGFGGLNFNRNSGRYLRTQLGYFSVGVDADIEVDDAHAGSPLIEIGKCSPF